MRQPTRTPLLLALLTIAASLSALSACSDPPPLAAATQPIPAPPASQPANPPAPAIAPPQQPAQGIAMTPQQQSTPTPSLTSLPPSTAYGDYAVGSVMAFAVDNRQRFDPWHSAYASDDAYRETLRRIEATGQTRTVVFQIWYPAEPDISAGRSQDARAPYPASQGRPSSLMDSYLQDADTAAQIIADAQQADPRYVQVDTPYARRILQSPQGAWLDAKPADGYFPLIILSHGGGGSHAQWTSFAEFLASNGYIVAAPTFISDGRNPLVFHDPDSPFANQSTPEEVRQAYQVLRTGYNVIPNFYRYMFTDESGERRVIPGGVKRTTTMMQNLFRQRIADVGLVAYTMRMLGEQPDDCQATLASIGATSAARELCGYFAGRVNADRIGLAGHSLGSITSQLALDHLPNISAALGLNTSAPYTWTPEETFGNGETPDGLPVGSAKPTLIMIGDEDAFVQGVFMNLFQAAVSAAGGDPAIAFPLDAELALPDRVNNPQPVSLSAWQRAISDRALVIVRDVDHNVLAVDYRRNIGNRDSTPPVRSRKPTGAAALDPSAATGPPETYNLLDWTTLADGTPVYMPHLIRDWYARAWFDWYLKDDQDAHDRLLNPDPFGSHTSVRSEIER